jgi:TatD DNase family protein
MLVDAHCHLHDREFFTEEQAAEFLKNAEKNGVKKIICIGTDPEDSLNAKKYAEAHKNVYWTYGVHPGNTDKTTDYKKALKANQSSKLVAIGEVGLDYHYGENHEEQIKLFREMLDLATKFDLPVSFHIREAFDDFFEIIKDYPTIRGVVHSYSDNKKNLRKILENTDFYVGVNGLATYSTLPTPPLEKIILETDAPFLTPVPNRGKINEPAYIKDIAQFLANKLGVSEAEVAEKTTENVASLFGI